jgi:hypothetical protein
MSHGDTKNAPGLGAFFVYVNDFVVSQLLYNTTTTWFKKVEKNFLL